MCRRRPTFDSIAVPPLPSTPAGETRTTHPSDLLALLVLCLMVSVTSLAQGLPFVTRHESLIRLLQLVFTGSLLFYPGRFFETRTPISRTVRLLLLVWIVASVTSVVFSMYPGPSIIRQAEWTTHIVFGFVLWHFLRRHRPSLQYIVWLVPVGFLLTGFFELGYWVSLESPRTFEWCTSIPLFGHLRHFGYYAMVALIFSVAPLLDGCGDDRWIRRVAALSLMTLCFSFLAWTGGRAAMGSSFVALVGILFFAEKGQRGWIVAVVVIATLVGLWVSSHFWIEEMCAGILDRFERPGAAGFLLGREEIWRSALEPIEGVRWLIGTGPNSYAYLPGKAFGLHPHSVLLQFLSEWGLLGALPALVLLWLLFRSGFKRFIRETDAYRKNVRLLALAVIVASTIHSLVDGLYYHAQPLLFLAVAFAIAVLPVDEAESLHDSSSKMAGISSRWVLRGLVVLLASIFLLSSNAIYNMLL